MLLRLFKEDKTDSSVENYINTDLIISIIKDQDRKNTIYNFKMIDGSQHSCRIPTANKDDIYDFESKLDLGVKEKEVLDIGDIESIVKMD